MADRSTPFFGEGLQITSEEHLQMQVKKWPFYFILAVLFLSCLVLAGWQFNIDFFKRPIADSVAMNPTTAITFTLVSISFFILLTGNKPDYLQVMGKIVAGFIILIALLKLAGSLFHWEWQVDQLLFHSHLNEDAKAGKLPAIMTSSIAFCFVFTGICLFILGNKAERSYKIAQLLALFVFFIGLFALVCYLYRVPEVYYLDPYLSMAIHTSLCFLFIALSIFFTNPGVGFMKEFTKGASGSVLAQKLIPAAIIIPVLLGLVRLAAHWNKLLSVELGATLLVLSIIMVFLMVTWYVTIVLNRRDKIKRLIEKKFELLLQAAPDAMIIANEKGEIELINQQTEKLFGYKKEEIIGMPVEMLVPPDLKQKHIEHRAGYHKQPKIRSMGAGLELYAVRKDGARFPVEISLSPIQTEHGTVVSASIRNITARKELEDQLRKSNEEMEAFTYSVSHDLRAPLRGIIGFTTILEEDYVNNLDEEANRLTAKIKKNTLKMGMLIDDLLSFSRAGRQEILKAEINSQDLVNEVIEEVTLPGKVAEIKWAIGKLPNIKGDRNTLRQVWINLISNAIKYSSTVKAPAIEIGSFQKEGQLVFFVRDNGIGFDEKYKHKLFKVFQRLHTEMEFEGTGVGLALVEKIVSKHLGAVWAEGTPNKGACFYFSLPVH